MKKTITTIAVSLLLSLGLLVAPASAADEAPAPTPSCEELATALATANEAVRVLSNSNAVLVNTVSSLRGDVADNFAMAQTAWAQTKTARDRADRLYVDKIELKHKLFVLRGKLRALHQR